MNREKIEIEKFFIIPQEGACIDRLVGYVDDRIAEAKREAYIDMAEIAVERIDCIEGDCESGDSLHVAIRTAKDEIKFALARRGIGEDGK
jgi:hypothetical protein